MFASATFGFFGGGSGVVTPLAGGWASDFYVSGFAQAAWSFNPDGSIDRNSGGYIDDVQRWHDPLQPGVGGSYWIRATVVSGSSPTGAALNTWLPLNISYEWAHITTPNDYRDVTLLIEISSSADVADLVTSGSFRITSDANLT
jgi:hypothetical protein